MRKLVVSTSPGRTSRTRSSPVQGGRESARHRGRMAHSARMNSPPRRRRPAENAQVEGLRFKPSAGIAVPAGSPARARPAGADRRAVDTVPNHVLRPSQCADQHQPIESSRPLPPPGTARYETVGCPALRSKTTPRHTSQPSRRSRIGPAAARRQGAPRNIAEPLRRSCGLLVTAWHPGRRAVRDEGVHASAMSAAADDPPQPGRHRNHRFTSGPSPAAPHIQLTGRPLILTQQAAQHLRGELHIRARILRALLEESSRHDTKRSAQATANHHRANKYYQVNDLCWSPWRGTPWRIRCSAMSVMIAVDAS